MTLKLITLWGNAATREAARVGAAEVDLDHLYLGLVALGGAAARLLGRHGISLASARRDVRAALADDLSTFGVTNADALLPPPLTLRELGEPSWRATPRAEEIIEKAVRAPDTYALLVTLFQEPTGTVRRLVAAGGVRPQDLVAELKQGADDPYATDRAPVDPGILPAPAHASALTRFVSAPAGVVADVLSDPASLALWALDPQRASVSEDGETVRHDRGAQAMTLRYHHKRERVGTTEVVTWIAEMLDGPRAGEPLLYERFEATPAPGGTELRRTSGRRRFGLLGRLMAPLWDSFSNWGMLHSTQAIAFGVADRQPG